MTIEALYGLFQAHPRATIDSRQRGGGLFFAVGQPDARGFARGNAFAATAIEQNAADYAIISDPELKAKFSEDERFILVDDAERSLQALATYHRKQLGVRILAIAGSNGKTTTKQLLTAALATKYKVFATPGNLNNHLGVPLSLLQLTKHHELAIIELGANHLHETAQLCTWVAPEYGLVTNCGKDHLGEYGSVENIIQANKELYDYLVAHNGCAFVNAADPTLMQASAYLSKRLLYQNESYKATLTQRPFVAAQIRTPKGSFSVETALFGAFWLPTLTAVTRIALHFGIDVASLRTTLERYRPEGMRSEQRFWRTHAVLLDCYNANPSSMHAFIREIIPIQKPSKVLILGEMLELGAFSADEHLALEPLLSTTHWQMLILVGPAMKPLADKLQAIHVNSVEELQVDWADKTWPLDTQFYVKGSRGTRLERLFER